MFETLFAHAPIWLIGPSLFLLLCLAAQAGYRLQRWIDLRSPNGGDKGSGAGQVLGVSLGLMSLLLSFTFSIAIDRYDARRTLVLVEANAIGTAYRRVDILAEPLRTALIVQFRDYTRVRIGFYEAGDDEAKLADIDHQTGVLQNQMWVTTTQAVRSLPNTDFTAALMESMNHMFDQTPARKAALAAHIPAAVLVGLTVLLVTNALMLGAVLGENRRRHTFLALLLLVLLSFTMTLVVDIDRPRQSHVRINQGPLLDLRAAMLSETGGL